VLAFNHDIATLKIWSVDALEEVDELQALDQPLPVTQALAGLVDGQSAYLVRVWSGVLFAYEL
jgi:hypothetical protein